MILKILRKVVLLKDLNLSVMNPHANLDRTCAVKSVLSKLPQTMFVEFKWKIRSMLENANSSMQRERKGLKVMKPVKLNKAIRILQADRDNSSNDG
jgi:hypothetical protein